MISAFEQVRSLLAREFELDPDKIRPQTELGSLGVDSLAALEFVFKLEDAFQIRVPDERDLRQGTVQDVVEIVDRALASARVPLGAKA